MLPYLRNVGRLDMENCRLSNEEMAELRAAFPSPKIVWRVNVGKYSCRTDAIMIRFSVHSAEMTLHQSDVKGLMYCNEVKYLDLGHNAFNDPYFIAYMPNLEVCILAAGKTEDLSALANCPNLEYLELFTCRFTDISPLANCKNLRHLNLCNSMITDITPLYGLTELERLWISASHVPPEQIERFRELVPTCLVNDTAEDPTTEWRFDPNRESTYTERYELLRKQFCYGTNITSYSEPPVLD